MPIYICVDCAKPLRHAQTNCDCCGSVDPFGARRAVERRQKIGFYLFVGVVMLLAGAFIGGLTPAMIKDFFHQ